MIAEVIDMRIVTEGSLARFRARLEAEERATATVEKYLFCLRRFCAWMQGREVDRQSLLVYKRRLCEGCSPSGVNVALSALNRFFSSVGWNDLRLGRLRVQRRLLRSEARDLTRAEYGRLLSAARARRDPRLFLLLQTLCSLGLRVSELRSITVEAACAGYADLSSKGKQRRVLLPRALCRDLLAYCKEKDRASGPVFVTRSGRPIDRSNIWREMKSLCAAAHVSEKKVFPHNLRHLFARTFYERQKDIVRLADLLGHSSVETTRIYTACSDETCRRQLRGLGLLWGQGSTAT